MDIHWLSHTKNYTQLKVTFDIIINNNNSGHYSPMRARACQLIGGLKSTCPQTEVNDHPASLRVTDGQHIKLPNRCWLFRLELPLHISSYPNSS